MVIFFGYQSGTFYYHYNHRGDVIAVSANNTGTIVFKANYDAYGKITRIDSGTFDPRYTFSTKRYFKDLGLYYYGYRWYFPELGRWTTPDPFGFKDSLNKYTFCSRNPVTGIDIYGLKDGKIAPWAPSKYAKNNKFDPSWFPKSNSEFNEHLKNSFNCHSLNHLDVSIAYPTEPVISVSEPMKPIENINKFSRIQV